MEVLSRRIDRLEAYGLPGGARLASQRLLERHRVHAVAMRQEGVLLAEGTKYLRRESRRPRPSALQLATSSTIGRTALAKNAKERSEASKQARACMMCGDGFTATASSPKMFCSKACASKFYAPAHNRDNGVAALRAYAAAERAKTVTPRPCGQCGALFVPNNRKRTMCGRRCSGLMAAAAKKTKMEAKRETQKETP